VELPIGTITFLFTDIEGSTRLWEQYPDEMRIALARHDALVREAIEAAGGHVFKTIGDAFCAAFGTARAAITATLATQLALVTLESALPTPLRVRMALHAGTAELRANDYFGPALNRAARLLAVGHGGQVLLSSAAMSLVSDHLPPQCTLFDLGIHQLKDLHQPENVWQLLHPSLLSQFPPLRSLFPSRNNLPLPLTSFIGREHELAAARRLLSTTRLMTLTGSGGIGKTRLALQLAAEVIDEYEDGVWQVELAPFSDPSLIPRAVANVLELREAHGRTLTDIIVEYLETKKLLLLLDNTEHMLPAVTALANALLRRCPDVKLLITSREVLGVAGEQTYRVPSLLLPDPASLPPIEEFAQYEAVRLFSERARAVAQAFSVSDRNAAALAQICYRLNGIPLAIELAAARIKALPVEQIATRLDDQFRLLTGGNRMALPRQQTLRALIDWSYDLLNSEEQTLLQRLSVFSGGWTLEAAEEVTTGKREARREPQSGLGLPGKDNSSAIPTLPAEDVLDLLVSLTDKSLVLFEDEGGVGRYRLLETVRQYARARLTDSGEIATLHAWHSSYFLKMVEEAGPKLRGSQQLVWLRRIDTEYDNLRAALEWSRAEQGNPIEGVRLAAALGQYWVVRGYFTEGRVWMERAWSVPDAPLISQAMALATCGLIAYWQGDPVRAAELADRALDVARKAQHDWTLGYALAVDGFMHRQHEPDRTRTCLDEARAIAERIGDAWLMGEVLSTLGVTEVHHHNVALGKRYFEAGLPYAQAAGDRWLLGELLYHLGMAATDARDDAAMRVLFTQSLAIFRELGDKRGAAMQLHALGSVVCRQGELDHARALFTESLALRRKLSNQEGIAASLDGFAFLAMTESDPERAVTLLGSANAIRTTLNYRMLPLYQEDYDQCLEQAQATLSAETFAHLWAIGQSLPLEEAIRLTQQI
jgi:predicted ATPase/class 3 adenylate cyclase